MELNPHIPGQTLFWLNAEITLEASLASISAVKPPDYTIVHKHFGHPSKDVLQKVTGNTKNFLSGI